MATASDIAGAALRKLGIRSSETPIEADEMADALETLNDMGEAHSWFQAVADSSTELNIQRRAIGPLKSLLAEKLAPEYTAASITPNLQNEFNEAWRTIYMITNGDLNVAFPNTLPVGSGNQGCNSYLLENRFFNEGSNNF